VCNWMNCTEDGYSQDQCESKCLSQKKSEFFCGLCENEAECIELSEVKTKKECEESFACMLGNHATLSKDESSCLEEAKCDSPCYEIQDNKLKTRTCNTKEECESSGTKNSS
jgi:hypothetical protein